MELCGCRRMYMYLHYGGSFIVKCNKSVDYDGGSKSGAIIDDGMSVEEVISVCCKRFNISSEEKNVWYSLKFDRSILMPLVDDASLVEIFEFNEEYGFAYIAAGNVEVITDDNLL